MSSTIKPFRAAYYNTSLIKDLTDVISPPYDIIDEKTLRYLKNKSPYNFSNILLAVDSNYKEAGKCFRKWYKDKILLTDDKENLYLYEQKFVSGGKEYLRFGIMALLRMDNKEAVFPHEYTLKEPKEDRKKIIKEVKANLSPIFVIAPTDLKSLREVYDNYSKQDSLFEFKDLEGNDNRVWRIDGQTYIHNLCSEINTANLVIADGHHRFEVSYDYYKKNKGRYKNLNYILAYITGVQKGLVILPTHRVVKVDENNDFFWKKLGEYFFIEKTAKERLCSDLDNLDRAFCFGIYHQSEFFYLKLKDKAILDKMFKDSVYKRIDTYLLHELVFPLFKREGQITYTHSLEEAQKIAGSEKTAFLLRTISLKNIFDAANKGYRLPQKSTYFYPKIMAGILVRRFEK